MAVMKIDQVDAREAGANLTDKLYFLAALNSDEEAVLAGDDGVVYGVITEEATEGNWCTLQTSGIAKVVASGAINAGARVASNGVGKAKAGATNAFGTARSTVTTDGDIVEVLLD